MKKALILSVCAVLVAAASVLGTLAYLTSQDTIVNTFTVGQVSIVLDETKVTPDGKPVEGADRVEGNEYHLLPGQTYTKDPRMTVVKGSEEAYVRMLVTVNCLKELDAIFASEGVDLAAVFNGYDAETWIYKTATKDADENTITYEFRYKETVTPTADADLVLDALFDAITVPVSMTGEDLAKIKELTITVVGHAIQAAGFDNEDAAWTAFDAEISG